MQFCSFLFDNFFKVVLIGSLLCRQWVTNVSVMFFTPKTLNIFCKDNLYGFMNLKKCKTQMIFCFNFNFFIKFYFLKIIILTASDWGSCFIWIHKRTIILNYLKYGSQRHLPFPKALYPSGQLIELVVVVVKFPWSIRLSTSRINPMIRMSNNFFHFSLCFFKN